MFDKMTSLRIIYDTLHNTNSPCGKWKNIRVGYDKEEVCVMAFTDDLELRCIDLEKYVEGIFPKGMLFIPVIETIVVNKNKVQGFTGEHISKRTMLSFIERHLEEVVHLEYQHTIEGIDQFKVLGSNLTHNNNYQLFSSKIKNSEKDFKSDLKLRNLYEMLLMIDVSYNNSEIVDYCLTVMKSLNNYIKVNWGDIRFYSYYIEDLWDLFILTENDLRVDEYLYEVTDNYSIEEVLTKGIVKSVRVNDSHFIEGILEITLEYNEKDLCVKIHSNKENEVGGYIDNFQTSSDVTTTLKGKTFDKFTKVTKIVKPKEGYSYNLVTYKLGFYQNNPLLLISFAEMFHDGEIFEPTITIYSKEK